ncbi:N-alpha-acetyltransferase 38-A, NatC auxiliary subunit [Tolypocladium ophioglossoides CBS 100239]|uniref:N-alpha-acetyltransferase 38-A, NatC auxiliary subunit n=1 Tax=Tolypocladium ophioglossoides (strain CBS 100239) TaxID=1163406 RepID=A0A0L0NB50_TOLOC|nr:N-alpha-acetyltransferase 38-A, NatC auxiliary subunit [Tolypocladium ophioglossoides CBS 100239]
MDKDEAQKYLQSLLNKNLRVVTTDGRLFWGSFKCTDPDKNVVLAHTYEYRHPSADTVHRQLVETGEGTVDMTSRYLGLVVVPGHHIVKMELEQFASQVKPEVGSR